MKTWEDLDKQTTVLQSSINELYQRFTALQNFHDAQEWDADAAAITELLMNLKNDWNAYRKDHETALDQLVQEHNNKKFMNKMFSKRGDENAVKTMIEKIDVEIKGVDTVVDQLTQMIDKTPTSKTEQEEAIEELEKLKKELTLLKRETNENLRGIRQIARQKTASWAGVTGGIVGRVARHQRMSARLEKERALIPIEDAKTFIEKRLIAFEKELNWVRHFKDDGQEKEDDLLQEVLFEQVERCKYCGRRVSEIDDTCKGCGAVI